MRLAVTLRALEFDVEPVAKRRLEPGKAGHRSLVRRANQFIDRPGRSAGQRYDAIGKFIEPICRDVNSVSPGGESM